MTSIKIPSFFTPKHVNVSIVLVMMLTACSAISQAKIYSWTDKNGKVHYGDRKVNNVEQTQVEIKTNTSTWQQYNIVVTDVDGVLSDAEKSTIQKDVNWVYRFYKQVMYFDMHKTIPISIRLFNTQEDYGKYRVSLGYSDGKKSWGVFLPARNEIVLYINTRERALTFNTIKHEVSHAILENTAGFVPAWLDEGMAENIEYLELQESKFSLLPHRGNHWVVNRDAKKGIPVNLKELLSLKSSSFRSQNKEKGNTNQEVAGELVRMLLSSGPGRSFLGRIVHKYKRGDRTFARYLVDDHYTGGLVVLQDNWNRWALRKTSEAIRL